MTGPTVPPGGEDELPPYMLANTEAEFERVRDAAGRRLQAEAEQIARGPGGQELREALLSTLVRNGVWPLAVAERTAAALLPVVLADRDRHAQQKTAEELHQRARMIWTRAAQENEDVEAALSETAAWLTARAAALTGREEAE